MDKKQKNILYVYDARFVSGLERSLLNIFASIDRKRFVPYFMGSRWSDEKFIKLARKLDVECATTNLRFIRRTSNPLRLLVYLVDYAITTKDLVNFIKKNKIDLMSAHSLHMCFYSLLASIITKKPLIWHEHATMPCDPFRKFVVTNIARRVSYFIAVSNSVKEHLVRLRVLDDKIMVVYNSVDLERFNPKKVDKNKFREKFNLSRDTFLVGLVGHIAPWKGHKDFIKAADIVCRQHGNVRFVIVGERFYSNYERELEDLITQLDLKEKVFFAGWYEKVEEVFCGLDVSILATTTEEPFGRVIPEAMACKTPVVATRVGGVKEIIEDGVSGMLVTPNNPEAMADAIIKLLDDESMRNKFGGVGRKCVEEKFSLKNIIQQLEEAYEKI